VTSTHECGGYGSRSSAEDHAARTGGFGIREPPHADRVDQSGEGGDKWHPTAARTPDHAIPTTSTPTPSNSTPVATCSIISVKVMGIRPKLWCSVPARCRSRNGPASSGAGGWGGQPMSFTSRPPNGQRKYRRWEGTEDEELTNGQAARLAGRSFYTGRRDQSTRRARARRTASRRFAAPSLR
jgi:hypothetical protein